MTNDELLNNVLEVLIFVSYFCEH